MNWPTILSGALLLSLALGLGIVVGMILLYRHNHKNLFTSVKYLFSRLKLAENENQKNREELIVLKEYFQRKGIFDEEDFILLKRELIDIPKRIEAEKNELLKNGLEQTKAEQLVKNMPDTYH